MRNTLGRPQGMGRLDQEPTNRKSARRVVAIMATVALVALIAAFWVFQVLVWLFLATFGDSPPAQSALAFVPWLMGLNLGSGLALCMSTGLLIYWLLAGRPSNYRLRRYLGLALVAWFVALGWAVGLWVGMAGLLPHYRALVRGDLFNIDPDTLQMQDAMLWSVAFAAAVGACGFAVALVLKSRRRARAAQQAHRADAVS